MDLGQVGCTSAQAGAVGESAGALQNWVQPESFLMFEQLTQSPQLTAFYSVEKGSLPKKEKERGHYNCEVKIGHGSNHAPTWLTSLPC